jgi:hypothetical protein
MSLALRYLLATHTARPAYLRIDGRPVIFFWRLRAIPLDGAENALEAWRAVRAEVDPNHQAIWIAEGDRFEFLEVFDGIYPYSVAWADDVGRIDRLYASRTRQQADRLGAIKLWVATVMPGYNDLKTGRADAFTRDRVNGAFFEETWRAAVDSTPDWVMITSWNEWVEGTQIESSRSYGERYVNANRVRAAGWKAVAPVRQLSGPPPASPVEVSVEDELPLAPEIGPHLVIDELLSGMEVELDLLEVAVEEIDTVASQSDGDSVDGVAETPDYSMS